MFHLPEAKEQIGWNAPNNHLNATLRRPDKEQLKEYQTQGKKKTSGVHWFISGNFVITCANVF